MPAAVARPVEEGLITPPVRLTEDVLALVCANSRTPRLRRGDFRAQVSANRVAQRRIAALVGRLGPGVLLAGFDEVLAYAERRTRDALRLLPDGVYRAETELEGDGVTDADIPIRVAVSISGDSAADRLRRDLRGGGGERQLPARRHEVRAHVRRQGAHGPGRPAVNAPSCPS